MNDLAATLAPVPQKAADYTRKVEKPRDWGASLSDKERKQIHEAAQKFEAMYVSEMMNYMFTDTDMTETEFGGGPGEKMYQPLLVNEYGKRLAASGQTGISSTLEREMLKMQELQRNPRLAVPTSSLHSADNKETDLATQPTEANHERAQSL